MPVGAGCAGGVGGGGGGLVPVEFGETLDGPLFTFVAKRTRAIEVPRRKKVLSALCTP